MPENNYREVRIIHPETGGVATVPESSLSQHYLAGWTLLADDLAPDPDPPAGPEPMTEAQVQADIAKRRDEFLAAERAIAEHDGEPHPPPDSGGDPNVPDPDPGGKDDGKDGSGDQAGKAAPAKSGAKAAGSKSGGSESN